MNPHICTVVTWTIPNGLTDAQGIAWLIIASQQPLSTNISVPGWGQS